MPLVSGVCRAASAPMLSHGGSRLNASKPEANPKTSCPIPKKNLRTKKTFKISTLIFFDFSFFFQQQIASLILVLVHQDLYFANKKQSIFFFREKKNKKNIFVNRIASQNSRTSRFSRWHEVHQKFTRILLFFYLAVIFFGKKKVYSRGYGVSTRKEDDTFEKKN